MLYPYVLPAADAFVERYEGTIRQTVEEILARMTVAGLLHDWKLDKLVARLRGKVEPFTHPPGGLTPNAGAQRAGAKADASRFLGSVDHNAV